MTSKKENGHLSPEVFVDVVEGVPVDASWQQHLSACPACQEELGELEQTLSLLNEDTETVLPTTEPAREPRGLPAWMVTAAAALVAAVGLYWLAVERDASTPTSVELEELLPPVEEDEEFQFLIAVSGAADEDLVEIAAPVFDSFALDPQRLTPGERQLFVERLTEEMRSSL